MLLGTGRSENLLNTVWRLLVRLALIAGILYACFRLRSVITTLFVAAIIAYVLDPIVEWLSRKRGFVQFHNGVAFTCSRTVDALRRLFVPTAPTGSRTGLRRHALRSFATLYVFVLAILVLWQGTTLVVTPFVSEFRALTSPEGRKQALANKEKALGWYNEHVPDWARSDKVQQQIRQSSVSGSLANYLQGAATEIGRHILESFSALVEILLLPVLAFYFLIDGRQLKHEFVGLLPRAWIRETLHILRDFNRIMRSFIVGQFILCLLAGVVVGVGLALLKVKYPMILGVFAGITRAIPIIGPIVGGIPIVVLTLVTKGMGVGLAVLGFFTFLHFAESKFIMPMLIGDRMNLHPVIIIVVLIVGNEVGGLLIGGQIGALLGMFFAAPVAAIIRVLVRRYWLHLRPGSPRPTSPAALPLPPQTLPAGVPETAD